MNTSSKTIKNVDLNTGDNAGMHDYVQIIVQADWAELNKRDRYFVSYLFDLLNAYREGTMKSDPVHGDRKMDLSIGDIVSAAKKTSNKLDTEHDYSTDSDVPF